MKRITQCNTRWLNHPQQPETSAGRISILPADVFKALVTIGGCPPTAQASMRMSHTIHGIPTLSIQIDKVVPNREFPMYNPKPRQQQIVQKHRAMSPDVFLHRDDRNAMLQASLVGRMQ